MQNKRNIIAILLLLTLPVGSNARHPDAVGRRGVVVSGNLMASRIGLSVLRRGGNAIDAAVATGFALAVTEPRAGNLGGGGFMVIRLADGTTTTIDFREKAPASASTTMFLDNRGRFVPELSRDGALASGVPGTVSGYVYAAQKYGTRTLDVLLMPSIELANLGYAVGYQLQTDLVKYADRLQKHPSTAAIFYPKGAPLRLNSLFKQPGLAKTLERISISGADGFYHGETANLIIRQMVESGGIITLDDLANYKPVERKAVEFDYRDVHVITMGPPSAGGIVLAQILNQLELMDVSNMGFHSAEHVHAMVEAEKRAFADRAIYLADPDFVPVQVDRLISDEYAESRWDDFSNLWATPGKDVGQAALQNATESDQTTHFSVVDRWGNSVSVTTTINGLYGCGIVVDSAGFFMNNEMADFSINSSGRKNWDLANGTANAIEPGKRMLSSMTPTIVTKNDQPYIVTGSPGSGKIITTVAQVISNMVDFEMDIKSAVEAPRFHHQWLPDAINIESHSLSYDTQKKLARMGHTIKADSVGFGAANSIFVDPVSGWKHGVADTRREAGASGY